VARADASGYTYFSQLSTNTANAENPTISQVIVTNGTDGFHRKASIAFLTNAVAANATGYGTWAINTSGTASNITGTLAVALGGTGATATTGSGSNVLATSPTLVTPLLGTPTSGVLTNCTGYSASNITTGTLPVAQGGTGATTTTGSGANVLATSPTLVTPLLGTPTSGVLTNCTGTAAGLTAGTATNATQLGGIAAASYAPLASPTFTGTPTLPTGTIATTQTAGDSSTKIATTAFVATSFAPKITTISNSIGADVVLNTAGTYYDGPSVAQGTIGTWYASGSITISNTGGATGGYSVKLWDGTTLISSGFIQINSAVLPQPVSLSGTIVNPAGNIRISVAASYTSPNNKMVYNMSGLGKDSSITAIRIG
jgi:hypothetical protein